MNSFYKKTTMLYCKRDKTVHFISTSLRELFARNNLYTMHLTGRLLRAKSPRNDASVEITSVLIYPVLCITSMLILSASAFAQDNCEQVEMAEGLYQSGKIYVVVAALAIIFIGIVIYLISLDRKISKLEKEVKASPTPPKEGI